MNSGRLGTIIMCLCVTGGVPSSCAKTSKEDWVHKASYFRGSDLEAAKQATLFDLFLAISAV